MYQDIYIENVTPSVDGGSGIAVAQAGDLITVNATIYAASHQALVAMVRLYNNRGKELQKLFMNHVKDDTYSSNIIITEPGNYYFTITAWINRIDTLTHGILSWIAAGEDVSGDLKELSAIVDSMELRAKGHSKRKFAKLRVILDPKHIDEKLPDVISSNFMPQIWKYGDKPGLFRTGKYRIHAYLGVLDRSWYEAFPRSQPQAGKKTGNFRSMMEQLTRISAMGFDILYLPPIHPIGKTNRRGKNGVIPCKPDDVGSPWAIGNEMGGHREINPELGDMKDFKALIEEAEKNHMQVAIDIAFQCSPDHPYVRNHPEWFQRRTDGTIRYAENPPKKYFDIYPFDFYCKDREGLWNELKDVVLFWRKSGVKFFRVDNPHTKPIGFWEWLIGEVKKEYPDTYFLSESFTTENLMYRLSKAGFDLSYSYFTWKNSDWEIKEYFSQLNKSEYSSFYTPVLFTNTPDILSFALQKGGRPEFILRAILAATLGTSWGIYSGYEICEDNGIPGREEYMNSEKYEIKKRDFDREVSIAEEIALLNSIRKKYRQFRERGNLNFLQTTNPAVLAYSRGHGSDKVVVVLNIDPSKVQEAMVRIPEEWNQPHSFNVIDVYNGTNYTWNSGENFVRLTPEFKPVHILQKVAL